MRILCLLLLLAAPALRAETVNIVVFFVDDLGWTDLGCTGSDLHETPNIDALAAEGVRFTSGYSACTVCSPSRAALLTGQYPARLRVTDFIPGHPFVNTPLSIPDWTQVLEKRHLTLPEMLAPLGYASAHVGKWHLAHRDRKGPDGSDTPDPDNYPEAHGFDVNVGGCEYGAPPSYFWPYGKGKTLEEKKQNSIFATLPEGDLSDEEREGEYLTDRLAEEAASRIAYWADSRKSFFLNFSFYNVHTPLQGRPDLVEKYEAKLADGTERKHTNPTYAAMVESVDHAVGRVVATLKEKGIYEETLIAFTSDNGGLEPAATENSPLRQGKGGIYEGGVRVPFIVRLPGGASGKLCHRPVITMDLVPTVFDAIGEDLPEEAASVFDGVSLLPILEDPRAELERGALYWHYPHYHSMGAQPYSAIRVGNWKLIEVIGQDRVELYDLASDIHEDINLLQAESAKAKELYLQLAEWRKSIDAQMPKRNPDFDPEKPIGVSRGGNVRPAAALRE